MYYLNRVTQGWGKLGLGLRPRQKKKKHPREKGSTSHIKLYIYIYIYFKSCAFFFISDVKDNTNFTIGLQIAMLFNHKKVI